MLTSKQTMVSADLTQKQLCILLWIANENAHSRGVTIRRIMTQFDIKSPNGVVCHLTALRRKGLLADSGKSVRGYRHSGTIRTNYTLFVPVSDKAFEQYTQAMRKSTEVTSDGI